MERQFLPIVLFIDMNSAVCDEAGDFFKEIGEIVSSFVGVD